MMFTLPPNVPDFSFHCDPNRCASALGYCCNNNISCCTYSYAQFAGLGFFLIICGSVIKCLVSCCIRKYRERRARALYTIVNNQPAYGSTSVTTAYSQPPPTYSTVVSSAPANTPAYKNQPVHDQ